MKTLATRTARATEDIKTQIPGIQAETDRGVTAIAGITQVIADLGGITASIAAAIEQQGVATTEIARSAQQAALGAETISSNLAALTHASGQSGDAAEAGRAASRQPSAQWDKMTGSARTFVGTLQAA